MLVTSGFVRESLDLYLDIHTNLVQRRKNCLTSQSILLLIQNYFNEIVNSTQTLCLSTGRKLLLARNYIRNDIDRNLPSNSSGILFLSHRRVIRRTVTVTRSKLSSEDAVVGCLVESFSPARDCNLVNSMTSALVKCPQADCARKFLFKEQK
jgi:hypothetical protein